MISNAHKQILTFGFVLLCNSISLPSTYAVEKKWFQLELIVFSNHNPRDLESEKWPHDTKQYQANKYAEVTTDGATLKQPLTGRFAPIIFQALSEQDLSLQKIAERLDDSNEYQVLLHTGWQQWVKKRHKPLPIYLDDANIDHSYQPVNRGFSALSPTSVNKNRTEQNQTPHPYRSRPAGPPEVSVYGMVSLRQGRFLHLALDLSHHRYQHITPTTIKENIQFPMDAIQTTPLVTHTDELSDELPPLLEPQVAQLPYYYLKESRRVRTNKLYYFDHPAFGVIAKITRIEAPSSPDENINTPEGVVNIESQ